MIPASLTTPCPQPARRIDRWLAHIGEAMARRRSWLLGIQWGVVLFYAALVIVPAWLPLPNATVGMLGHLTLIAQFVFWGLWWPGVMLATMLVGRLWCGVFCPEGALSEWASRHGRGRPVPRWLKWGGWPFIAFALTTLYGQMVSVYEYPKPALLVLGGSTLAAIAIGLVYGRGKRVWCRHLCPASGVFALLTRIAPLHFHVDRATWDRHPHPALPVDCAPLVDIRRMQSSAECHACGRCAGHRHAVQLALRSPNTEILTTPAKSIRTGEMLTLLFGVLGIATGAFQWSMSPWFVNVKQGLAEWLISRGILWPFNSDAPWWLFTHYPDANDTFTWLDGGLVIAYILAVAVVMGGTLWLLCTAGSWLADGRREQWKAHALTLIPMGGASVFIGLSMLTVTLLRAEGLLLLWVPAARATLLTLAALWSIWLGLQKVHTGRASTTRRWLAVPFVVLAPVLAATAWAIPFWVW